MKLKWLGHACFLITLNDGSTILTDPYDDSVGYPPLRARADVVLSSHGHHDHNNFAAVEGDPLILNAAGGSDFCGARIIGVPSCHDDAGGSKRGSNIIFRIEADGLCVAHLGDLGHLPDTDEQRAALRGLDVMLIPIGGYYTIDTPTAVRIIREFQPRMAIAMHYSNQYCHFPISGCEDFLRETSGSTLPNEIDLSVELPEGCFAMAF